jgi:zinc transport system permease protein
MDYFSLFFHYAFVHRALLAGVFVAVACATLGMFLVLRKMSLIGDGLSHVGFGAIALGLLVGVTPLLVAWPLVLVASVVILKLSQRTRLYGDAAIGVVSVVGIASGVLLASLSGGLNVSLLSYLFGNILAVTTLEVWLSVILSIGVLFILWLAYWDLFAMTFDEEYAEASGVATGKLGVLLALLTAVTVVLSIKVVGVFLVSALLLLPAIISLQLAKRFSIAILLANGVAVFSVFVGIFLSFVFDVPTGATIVLLLATIFGFAFWYKRIR